MTTASGPTLRPSGGRAAPKLRRRARSAVVTALCAAAAIGGLAAPAGAAARPDFQLPFPCGETWSGRTFEGHGLRWAVDLTQGSDDAGKPVVASAAGTVKSAITRPDSYGRYVVIDHGDGWTTYYAHLSSYSVGVGDEVAAGQRIGRLGSTGNSSGPHLHYEQRASGASAKIVFDGSQIHYDGKRSYTSRNACGSEPGETPTGHPGTIDTAGAPLTVRSGPGTGYAAAGTVADGEQVTISCQTTGTQVTGTFGTSRIWDRIGADRYVSDAYVRTGSDGLVAPSC